MGELLADLERFRPALPATTPKEQLQALVQERAQLRLTELYREYRIDEQPGDPDDLATLGAVQVVGEVLFELSNADVHVSTLASNEHTWPSGAVARAGVAMPTRRRYDVDMLSPRFERGGSCSLR